VALAKPVILGNIYRMENRLREYRKRAGLTLESVSERLGLSISQVSRLERGASDLTGERLQQFAGLYGVRPADFLEGGRIRAPLVGFVGPGAEVLALAPTSGTVWVDLPLDAGAEVAALEVRSDSLFPAHRPGDLLFYAPTAPFVADECLGAQCVARLADGPTLVTTLASGAQPERWTLYSTAARPLENAALAWAAPVLWVDKRRR